MKKLFGSTKHLAIGAIAAGALSLINVLFLDEPGGFPRGLAIAFSAGVLIMGILLLFVNEKPESTDMKEKR